MMTSRSSLPSNVRRWLDRSLPEDAPLPNRIQHTQEGEMDIRGRWMPFTATTVYRAQPHTFTWKARFSMLPGVWLVAEDGHDDDSGWGGAKLWGILAMGGRKGSKVRAMQLVRSLAELPWKPQLALALPGLEWNDTSDTAFEARMAGGDQAIAVCFELDGQGDIVDSFSMQYAKHCTAEERKAHFYVTRADVWGDSRDEVLLFGSRGACIYANATPLAIPTLYNNTLYPGM